MEKIPKILEDWGHREDSLTRFLNHLPGMAYRCVVKKNMQFRMVFASTGCQKLLGVAAEDVMRTHTNVVEKMTLEEDLFPMRDAIRKAVARHEAYNLYYRVRTPLDDVKWIWDQGEGVFDRNGECIFLEGIMMDVTGQKTAEQNLQRENHLLRAAPATTSFGSLVGSSAAMRDIYPLLSMAARSDASVILYGETGVGKDMAARTIHEMSNVKGRYIPVNCGAIPEHLLESEFFGHVKGAFSGAMSSRQGYLAAADGGTLFLDEVAELPLHLQIKLLRALDGKTYTPVGSSETRTSHFRLVSATNKNLRTLVKDKIIRADFFYRIHVLSIVLPPLRKRREDIPLLVLDYAKKKDVNIVLPEEILRHFAGYTWPGNVRELYNALDNYRIFGDPMLDTTFADTLLDPAFNKKDPDVLKDIGSTAFQESSPSSGLRQAEIPGMVGTLGDVRDETEKRRILAALEQNYWKKGRTAESLHITMRTLQRKLKKYGIR
jgi:transcriptional regulator with PAS, ATPase and Fis domain